MVGWGGCGVCEREWVWLLVCFVFLMMRGAPRSTKGSSSAASDVYKGQVMCIIAEHFWIMWLSKVLGFVNMISDGFHRRVTGNCR